jgi:hypothetical protein
MFHAGLLAGRLGGFVARHYIGRRLNGIQFGCVNRLKKKPGTHCYAGTGAARSDRSGLAEDLAILSAKHTSAFAAG